jgi:hypothetical protein
MFVRNRTTFEAVLARGNFNEQFGIASINVEIAYCIGPSGLLPLAGPLERAPTDPPDITRYPLWIGVSVTATGTVRGPSRAPFVRKVALSVGSERRELLVFGDRTWQKRLGGDLEASETAPFEDIPLVFERAFGGSYELPPGLFPLTNLPHPGLLVVYPRNPHGVGFYPDKDSAAGKPLPNIELVDQPSQRWNDTPEPGGFAPCPTLTALRAPSNADAIESDPLAVGVRGLHHAPGRLIFPSVKAGTTLLLEGVGSAPRRLELTAPRSPVRVEARPVVGRSVREIAGEIRSIHIDADGERVIVVHAHALVYPRSRAPGWFHITASA